eukprot:Hpha_TRINITY_DN13939_c0_g1::TRINITY_DN13939_c0_g1_i1::g.35609::m.35609
MGCVCCRNPAVFHDRAHESNWVGVIDDSQQSDASERQAQREILQRLHRRGEAEAGVTKVSRPPGYPSDESIPSAAPLPGRTGEEVSASESPSTIGRLLSDLLFDDANKSLRSPPSPRTNRSNTTANQYNPLAPRGSDVRSQRPSNVSIDVRTSQSSPYGLREDAKGWAQKDPMTWEWMGEITEHPPGPSPEPLARVLEGGDDACLQNTLEQTKADSLPPSVAKTGEDEEGGDAVDASGLTQWTAKGSSKDGGEGRQAASCLTQWTASMTPRGALLREASGLSQWTVSNNQGVTLVSGLSQWSATKVGVPIHSSTHGAAASSPSGGELTGSCLTKNMEASASVVCVGGPETTPKRPGPSLAELSDWNKGEEGKSVPSSSSRQAEWAGVVQDLGHAVDMSEWTVEKKGEEPSASSMDARYCSRVGVSGYTSGTVAMDDLSPTMQAVPMWEDSQRAECSDTSLPSLPVSSRTQISRASPQKIDHSPEGDLEQRSGTDPITHTAYSEAIGSEISPCPLGGSFGSSPALQCLEPPLLQGMLISQTSHTSLTESGNESMRSGSVTSCSRSSRGSLSSNGGTPRLAPRKTVKRNTSQAAKKRRERKRSYSSQDIPTRKPSLKGSPMFAAPGDVAPEED